jgi:hypothetical protein
MGDHARAKENTYEFVVSAADELGSASASSASSADAEDIDGGASQASRNGEVLDNDTQERKESGSSSGSSLKKIIKVWISV